MTKNYYVNGNTVRELDAPIRPNRRSREELEQVKHRKNRRNAARRNRQRAMEMSPGYVMFLTAGVLVIAMTAASLVNLQSQITSRMRNIANLEGQVTDLRADNDARYKSVTTSVDLNHVKDVAINKLGMDYPSEDQVVYYTIENTNYMDQYSDIPKQ